MLVELQGTKSDGKKFRKEIEADIEELALSANQLVAIDLSPLAQCTELQELHLDKNQLATLDLAPLENCTKLQRLYLFENQLAAVDLAPLEKCPELQRLGLADNRLASLDLAPLEKCTKLQELYLSKNQLSSLDLSPLAQCPELQGVTLHNNQLVSVDLFPLQSCQKLQWIRLDSEVSIVWRSIELDLEGLPKGLKEHSKDIKQAWEEFTEAEQKRERREAAYSSILKLLPQLRPNIPVVLSRFTKFCQLSEEEVEAILTELLKEHPNLGEYLELEQVFIRSDGIEEAIDDLLKSFEEFEQRRKGKKR